MSYSRIAAVTGANKGIGLAIVRNLALKYPSSTFNDGPLLIYLTARDASRGEAAVEALCSDDQLVKAKALRKDGGLTDIRYRTLDISKSESIKAFGEFLKKEHPDGIDIVVNNAGVAMDGFDANTVHETLKCNYYGTLEASQTLLPLIRDGGRLVNVSSMMGALSKYSKAIRNSFLSAKTPARITTLMEEFEDAVKAGQEQEKGWPRNAYSVSKAGVTGLSMAIADEEKRKGSKTLINACCPGYVNTDMSKGNGSLTPDQGARTPVLLALGDIGEQTGLFWSHEKPAKW